MKKLLLASCLLLISCSTESGFTNDFTPPQGADLSMQGNEGPWATRIMSARSYDGVHWTKTNQVISDQADVPEVIVDDQGWLYLYYYGWTVGKKQNIPAVAISTDNGETWTFKNMKFSGFPGRGDAADPDLLYEDGTFKYYGSFSKKRKIQILYAESTDGINFKYIGNAFEREDYPAGVSSTFKWAEQWHMHTLATLGIPIEGLEEGTHWYATSEDGQNFNFVEAQRYTVQGRPFFLSDVLVYQDGLRAYMSTPSGDPIRSWWSYNGQDWSLESYIHLKLDEAGGLEQGFIANPSITRLVDGSYFMAYTTEIPN